MTLIHLRLVNLLNKFFLVKQCHILRIEEIHPDYHQLMLVHAMLQKSMFANLIHKIFVGKPVVAQTPNENVLKKIFVQYYILKICTCSLSQLGHKRQAASSSKVKTCPVVILLIKIITVHEKQSLYFIRSTNRHAEKGKGRIN